MTKKCSYGNSKLLKKKCGSKNSSPVNVSNLESSRHTFNLNLYTPITYITQKLSARKSCGITKLEPK